MKKLLALAAILFFTIVSFAQGPLKGPLDKKIYRVDLVKDGKEKPIKPPDDLKFLSGKFKSTYFSEWGFKNAIYQATLKDSASQSYDVQVEATNDIKETMKWDMKINGDDIEGSTELINKKGETKYAYTFTGKIKAKYGKEE